jgi:uncharacterized protein YdcH (DUF465 family)
MDVQNQAEELEKRSQVIRQYTRKMNKQIEYLQSMLDDKNRLINTSHQIMKEQLKEIERLTRESNKLNERIERINTGIVENENNVVNLLQQRDSLKDQLEKHKKSIYETDYLTRRTYYMAHIQSAEQSTEQKSKVNQILQICKKTKAKGMIVSPETLPYENQRVQKLLQLVSQNGYLCFECRAKRNEADDFIEKVNDHHYIINEEYTLLPALRDQRCIVLATWVLQSAWFDLLPTKELWYDLCAPEKELFWEDAGMKLEHWKSLSTSSIVSYYDEAVKYLTYYRQDAKQLTLDFPNEEVDPFFNLLSDHLHNSNKFLSITKTNVELKPT